MTAYTKTSCVSVEVKFKSIADQTIVNLQHGAAIGLYLDSCRLSRTSCRSGAVLFAIQFITVFESLSVYAVQCRRIGGIDRGPHRAAGSVAVFILPLKCTGGIVIDFLHVNDGVIDRRAIPFRIKGRILFDLDRCAGRLRQLLIQIPAPEGIAGTGGIGGGNRDHRLIGNGRAGDIAAAIGLIGELIIPAGILHHELLAGSLGNGIALGALQHRIVEGFDRGGHIAVENAINVLFGVRDLRIFIIGQILELVNKVILRRVRNIFEADRAGFVCIKLIRGHGDRRRFRIIDGCAGNLIRVRLGRGRRRDGIRQLIGFDLEQVGIELDLLAAVIDIVVFRRDVIDAHGPELGNRDDGAVDFHIPSHLGALISLEDPLLKKLSRHKGVLRQIADSFTAVAVILRNGPLRPIIVNNDELDFKLAGELRTERKVGGHGLAAFILRLARKPTEELLARNRRGARQRQRLVSVIGISVVLRFIDQKDDRKGILRIVRPDAHVGRDRDAVREISDAVITGFIYPLGAVAIFGRHLGDVIQAVAGIHIDGLFGNERSPVFLVKRDRISDLVVVRDDIQIVRNDKSIRKTLIDDPVRTLAVWHFVADRPIADIIFTRFRLQPFITLTQVNVTEGDLRILRHGPRSDDIAVSITESKRPDVLVLSSEGLLRIAEQVDREALGRAVYLLFRKVSVQQGGGQALASGLGIPGLGKYLDKVPDLGLLPAKRIGEGQGNLGPLDGLGRNTIRIGDDKIHHQRVRQLLLKAALDHVDIFLRILVRNGVDAEPQRLLLKIGESLLPVGDAHDGIPECDRKRRRFVCDVVDSAVVILIILPAVAVEPGADVIHRCGRSVFARLFGRLGVFFRRHVFRDVACELGRVIFTCGQSRLAALLRRQVFPTVFTRLVEDDIRYHRLVRFRLPFVGKYRRGKQAHQHDERQQQGENALSGSGLHCVVSS